MVTWLLIALELGSLVFVWIDARDRDWSRDGIARSRLMWVLGCILLWPIVFPLYLIRRRRAPLSA